MARIRPKVEVNYSRFWDDAIYNAQRSYPEVSESLVRALERYVKDRIPTGGFLRAVLENNLIAAVSYADVDNIVILDKIVRFVHVVVPVVAQGSEDKVNRWIIGVEEG